MLKRTGKPDAAARQAAEWRAKCDGGLSREDERAFARWLAADPRHAALFGEFGNAWARLDRAKVLAPADLDEPEDSVFRSRERTIRFWVPVGLAAAAAVVLAALRWRHPRPSPVGFAETSQAEAGWIRRVDLPDGSQVLLDAGAAVSVRYTAGEREVALLRGEAFFKVAKNPFRPFVVGAAGVAVRAVGTAFEVRRGGDVVEVLVQEGRVCVDDAVRHVSLLPGGAKGTPVLAAGEQAVVPLESGPRLADLRRMTAPQEARALAWRERRLEFTDAPLADIVAAFNRCNERPLVVGDPELAALRFGGSFRADDPETFLQLLATRPGIAIERRPGETLIEAAR